MGGLLGCSFDAGELSDTNAETIGPGDSPSTTSTGTVGSDAATSPTEASSAPDPTGKPSSSSAASVASDSEDSTGDGPDTPSDTEGYEASSGDEGLLVNDGVVVRYFLDEAPSGGSPILAADSTDDPFDLPVDYTGEGLSYVEVDGNRGLEWSAVGLDAGARAPLVGSELEGLAGVTSLTFEVVFQIEEVMNQGSRILHVGAGNPPGRLSLASPAADELEFAWNDTIVRTWTVKGLLNTRHVAHVVVDTTAPNATDRIRLVLDGAEVVPKGDGQINQGETATLGGGVIFALGNRDMQRSFRGVLFYAAVYAGALGDAAIAQNIAVLLKSDDG